MGNESNTTQETQFVFRRLEEALRLFGKETDARWFWIFALAVILAAGLFYVAWMYRRDRRSIRWYAAMALAILRSCVYLLLAWVFLLPAMQTWERTETRSRVVVLFDVSGSMGSRDGLPSESVPVEKLPSRQDQVISFLTDDHVAFLKQLAEKNPVYAYRFGNRVDEAVQVFDAGKSWSAAEWNAWLKPNPNEPLPATADDAEKQRLERHRELVQQLVGGTNLGGSLVDVVNRESNNMVQGVIVFSDGRSTEGSSQSVAELQLRARRAKVPVFTVVVGEHRQPVSIRITGVQAPEQARPEDKFPIRVEVEGDGMPNKDTVVRLDVVGPRDEKKTIEKPFKFSAGSGGPPNAQVEFEVDAAELGAAPAPGKAPELAEGEWVFRARVPRDPREVFLDKEHRSENARVRVVKKPLRVLLFSGAAGHDFQFLRNLLVREVDQRRAELSVCLQIQRPGVVQDVPPERLLSRFPDRLGDDARVKPEERYYSLSEYDLIIAFDPDWTALTGEQMRLLQTWIGQHAGGLIVVAGPVNTYQLARPANADKLKPVLDLYPVKLQDNRIQSLGGDRPTTDPWRLHFPGATSEMEFLKLDDEGKEPLAGWEQFFSGKKDGPDDPNAAPVRGFYSFYPVDAVKPSATVVATFGDPRARLREGGKEMPYLVSMPFGSGKVAYIGSSETYRLRQCREVFHERFWTKLARYAGSGNLTRLASHGVLVMGQEFKTGQLVRLEAQLFGRDMQPLSEKAVPKATLVPPTGAQAPPPVDLKPKPRQGGDWAGWFQGQFRAAVPGEYRLNLQVPETGETLPRRFFVKEANPELDNTRPDFAQMYQLASEMSEILPRIDADRAVQDELRKTLEATAARLLQRGADEQDDVTKAAGAPRPAPAAKKTPDARDAQHLLFDLASAHLIPKCMVTDSKVQRSRGPVKDLWDEGVTVSDAPRIQFAIVLLIVAGLLSAEWLTRKLLRLA